MISRLVVDNQFAGNDLQTTESSRCPSVEVERDLAAVVAKWQLLSNERKRSLADPILPR